MPTRNANISGSDKMSIKNGEITVNSRIKDLYNHPIGRDLAEKIVLSLGAAPDVLTNPVVSNIKLSTLMKLSKGLLTEELLETILSIVNSEKDIPSENVESVKKSWWKEAVFYQIYPRSFYDTNDDGIGDLKGIIEKLDYLKDLGVNALWLSPVYDSPNDDNGYDIRDYKKIMSEFGTMEDFDKLLEGVHERGMKLIMDLVINHTSDEHEWFRKALQGDPKYHDYYIFRKGTPDKAPNNWTSFFSGPAWNYYPELGEWGLHIFSKKQMDLNWENPELRKDVYEMVNWWLEKGVDGFRLDAVNYISKREGLPDGDFAVGELIGVRGIENYMYGPKLHEYFRLLQKECFDKYDAFSVGETAGLGMQMAKLVSNDNRKELNMVFSFDHLETPGHVRMNDYVYDLNYFRDYMVKWMKEYAPTCQMSLYYNNHDNPRMVSKISSATKYHQDIQKLLAVMQFTLKGTPFIFQGDEMGIANYTFSSMDEIEDVESKGYYEEHVDELGMEETFKIICAGTREHARILLPWNETTKNRINLVRQQTIDEEITDTYKKLIALRAGSETLIYGDFELISDKKDRFTYKRTGNEEYIIDCNLSDKKKKAYVPKGYMLIFPEKVATIGELQPYEARIFRKL